MGFKLEPRPELINHMFHYINNYYCRLNDLRRITGGNNEGAQAPAFAGLLEGEGVFSIA